MKQALALGIVYATSCGLIVGGVETERLPEDWAPALYLIWASVGLGAVFYALRRHDAE